MKGFRSIWIPLLLLFLFLMLVRSLNWQVDSPQEIYFSDFLNYLDRDEIREITLQGHNLEGTLNDETPFSTYGVATSGIVEEIYQKGIVFKVAEKPGTPWYISLFLHWGPLLLLVGFWLLMLRRIPGGASKVLNIGKSNAKAIDGQKVNVTFKDIAGVDEAKTGLEELIDFLRQPKRFSDLGGRIPKGVLMVGPPGTGKTLLAKAVAGEAEVPFFSVSGSEFVEMFVGVGASRVRDLFEKARQSAPCIIFMDEIDAVGRHRGAGLGSGHDEREQTLNQLLVEMDGFDTVSGIIIIAATNRVDILDPAILRPGRFDRQVYIHLPDVRGREAILKVHANKVKLAPEADLSIIARGTPGFSGAQLANLLNEAALRAAKLDLLAVNLEELEWARDKILMGAERKSMILQPEEKEVTAYHEAGHAIVASYLKHADPVHKVTIIPRGHALGITSFLPENDPLNLDKSTLNDKITISMGGRAAEELVYKEHSTGVEGDLKYATNLAYNMVCKWGMSNELGALALPEGNNQFLAIDYHQKNTVSEDIKKMVDQEIHKLLESGYQTAFKILTKHKSKLKKLALLLLEKETVDQAQLAKLLGKKTLFA